MRLIRIAKPTFARRLLPWIERLYVPGALYTIRPYNTTASVSDPAGSTDVYLQKACLTSRDGWHWRTQNRPKQTSLSAKGGHTSRGCATHAVVSRSSIVAV